jgi:UDP-glucose 4-epimerase
VNVASGTRTSLLDLIAALEQVLDRPLDVEHGPARPGDVRDSCGDPTALRVLFPGLRTGSVEAGLGATVRWHTTRRDVAAGPATAAVPRPRSGLRRTGDQAAEPVHPALPGVDT